jgi:hypothetical protein
MKKYYIHNGQGLDGPYSMEEVQQCKLFAYQSIWYQSPSGLTTVDDLQELRALKNEPLSYQGSYKGVFPISCMNKKLNEGSKIVSMLKKAYAALFY